MWRALIWSLRLRRVEYRVAELPIFLIPILLVAPPAAAFLSLTFWEGLVIFLLLYAVGDLVNCVTDRDLDAIYKPHLTEAVYGLGVRNVVAQAVLSAVAALVLAVHLAWLLDRWLLVPMVLIGLAVAAAYSVEPVRLKRRGLWQVGFHCLALFTGPMLFAALLFTPWPPAGVVAVAACYGMMQTGVVLVNTAEDYPEDRQLGVRTVIVTLGLPRALTVAAALTLAGGLGLVVSLGALFLGRDGPSTAIVGLTPLVLAWAAAGVMMTDLAQRVRRLPEAEAIQAVKRGGRWVPAWITSLAVSTLVAALMWYGTSGTTAAPSPRTDMRAACRYGDTPPRSSYNHSAFSPFTAPTGSNPMNLPVSQRLLRALAKVDRPGSFCVHGSVPAFLPGLDVDGVGPVPVPLTPHQAEPLKHHCKQAPYGKGEKTLVDTNVRRVWQLTPDRFRLTNPAWQEFLTATVTAVQRGLGLDKQPLESHLYNLLL